MVPIIVSLSNHGREDREPLILSLSGCGVLSDINPQHSSQLFDSLLANLARVLRPFAKGCPDQVRLALEATTSFTNRFEEPIKRGDVALFELLDRALRRSRIEMTSNAETLRLLVNRLVQNVRRGKRRRQDANTD